MKTLERVVRDDLISRCHHYVQSLSLFIIRPNLRIYRL